MEIKYDKKLFKKLDTIVRVKIIDKINDIAYKVFDGVYSIKDLKYGEENITLKAWVKERENDNYRLVEGLYCKNTEKLYMLDSAICVLGLNIKKLTDEEIKAVITQKKEEKVSPISDLKETCKIDNFKEEYDIDEEDGDSNIWTRLKEKFGLKLKK